MLADRPNFYLAFIGLLCCLSALTGCITSAPGPSAGSIEVLSYNVHGLPSAITGDDTTARQELIAPLLNNYDLVGLQESFIDSDHKILAAAANHSSQSRFAATYEPDRVYGSGLAAFMRFNIIEVFNEHYSTCNGTFDAASDCLASKGFQVLRIELAPGLELDFYNTHLEAGGSAADDEARSPQIDQLITSLIGRSLGRAVIFTGDFNLHRVPEQPADIEMIDRLTTAGQLLDVCESLDCPDPTRIDRIFYRDSAEVILEPTVWSVEQEFVDKQGVNLSDHQPIHATITWGREPGAQPNVKR